MVFKFIFIITENYVVWTQASKARKPWYRSRQGARKGSGAMSAPEPGRRARAAAETVEDAGLQAGSGASRGFTVDGSYRPTCSERPRSFGTHGGVDTAVGGQRPRPRGAGCGRLLRPTTAVCAPEAGTRLCVGCGFGAGRVSVPGHAGMVSTVQFTEDATFGRSGAVGSSIGCQGCRPQRPAPVQKLDAARMADPAQKCQTSRSRQAPWRARRGAMT